MTTEKRTRLAGGEREPGRRPAKVVSPLACAAAAFAFGAGTGLLGLCGPFADTAGDAFCPPVLEIFVLGITTGTTATTYSPGDPVNRLQMAAFLSRTVDRLLQRSDPHALLDRFWTSETVSGIAITKVPFTPQQLQSDGADVWVASSANGGTVLRLRASDGKLLETWTGAPSALAVLVAMNRVLVTGATYPSSLYRIDPSQAAGSVTTVASNLGAFSRGITFDGARIWTADIQGVSIVTPAATIPWTVTTVTTGFGTLVGALYDGANVWVSDNTASTLMKLDASGAILQTVTVGPNPTYPAFDGTSIWVPNSFGDSVTVVRASSGAVLGTLTGNGLTAPSTAAFDGRRVLVTNGTGNSVSLWKADDLTPLGSFPTGPGTFPFGACSDGFNFWVTLDNAVARF